MGVKPRQRQQGHECVKVTARVKATPHDQITLAKRQQGSGQSMGVKPRRQQGYQRVIKVRDLARGSVQTRHKSGVLLHGFMSSYTDVMLIGQSLVRRLIVGD